MVKNIIKSPIRIFGMSSWKIFGDKFWAVYWGMHWKIVQAVSGGFPKKKIFRKYFQEFLVKKKCSPENFLGRMRENFTTVSVAITRKATEISGLNFWNHVHISGEIRWQFSEINSLKDFAIIALKSFRNKFWKVFWKNFRKKPLLTSWRIYIKSVWSFFFETLCGEVLKKYAR